MDENVDLDPKDWAILAVLQRDASLSVQAIGDTVGLSANPCWRRIKRMEDAGIIDRKVALLNPEKIGLGTTVFVNIKTNQHDPKWLDAFSQGVSEIDEIIECHRMAGDVDYMLVLQVRDIGDYDRIYQRLIAKVPDLADVSASFSMERMKHTTALPRPA